MINQVYDHADCIYVANEIYCKTDPYGILVKDSTTFILCGCLLFGLVVVGFVLGRLK